LGSIQETMQAPASVDGLGNRSEVRAAQQATWLLPDPSTTTEGNTSSDRNPGAEAHQDPSADCSWRVDGAHDTRLLRRPASATLRRAASRSYESSQKLRGERALGKTPASGSKDRDSGDQGSTHGSVHQIATDAPSTVNDAHAIDNKHGDSSQEDWLSLHAADLIRNIQNWADALDSREMQLDARVLRHEQLERRFRLRWQDFELDLSKQRNAIDQLQHEFDSQSRQLAQE